MPESKQFPPWVQNALGVVLGTAILGIGFAAWNDRASDARRDERLNYVESRLDEFGKPSRGYHQVDGDRDRRLSHAEVLEVEGSVKELARKFYVFRDQESRASPQIKQLSDRIKTCHELAHENSKHWTECQVTYSRLRDQVYFLSQVQDDDKQFPSKQQFQRQ